MLRLITIPISHYCEKARWSLDRAGIGYREERHIQGIHRVVARRVGGGMTVPVLVTEERVIPESRRSSNGSTNARPRMSGSSPRTPRSARRSTPYAAASTRSWGRRGGVSCTSTCSPSRASSAVTTTQGVPSWEHHFFRYSRPLTERLIRRVLDIRPGVEVQDEAAVFREFDFVAERLADGRPYLCGDRFGAADLTFAALAASVLMPPQYGVRLPQPDEFVPDDRGSREPRP